MEITRILLRNWTSHKRSEVVFGKGANVIVGPIGAGKSSIFDAISYALFGRIPNVVKAEEVVRRGEREAEVVLEFSHKGHTYRVERSIGVGKRENRARLYKDGKWYAERPAKVSREIERLLEVDYHSFLKAIYAPQNEIELFLELPPKERKKAIDDMLNIERFQSYVDEIRRVANLYRKELALLGRELEREREERVRQELREVEKALREVEEAWASLGDLGKLEAELKELERREGELREVEERRREIARRIERIAGELEALKEVKVEPEEPLRERLSLLAEKVRRLEERKGRLKASLVEVKRKEALKEKLRQEQERARERLKAIEKRLSQRSPVEELEKKVEKLKALLARIDERRKEVEERKDSLSRSTSTCPVCGRPLEEEHREKLLREAEEALLSLKEKEKKVKALLAKALEELKRARALDREQARLEGEKAKLLELLSQPLPKVEDSGRVEAELERVEGELKALMKEKAEVEVELSTLLEKKRKVERRQALEGMLSTLKEEMAKLPPTEGLEELREELKALREKVAALRERKRALEEKRALLGRRREELTSTLEELERKKARLQKVEALLADLQLLGNAIESVQLRLRQEVVVAINEALATLWPLLYPYKDYTALKLEAEEKGYELYLYSDRWERVNAVASGGERAIAALTLRVALAMAVAPHIGLLILDEPTHNLDERAVEALKESLRDELPSIVGQFFIITHDERLAEIGGRVIRVERRKEGMDEAVVRVEG